MDLEEFQPRSKVSGLNFATSVCQTGRRQFSLLILFAPHTFDADAKLDCVLTSVCITALIASVSAAAEVRFTARVIPASAVFRYRCVCHLVFLVEIY